MFLVTYWASIVVQDRKTIDWNPENDILSGSAGVSTCNIGESICSSDIYHHRLVENVRMMKSCLLQIWLCEWG